MKYYRQFTITLLLIFANSGNVFAFDFFSVSPSGDTLYYDIIGTNAKVTYPNATYTTWFGYTMPSDTLEVPSTVINNGITYTVTAIGYMAFRACRDITFVILPNSVTEIANGAFYNCTGIRTLSIPNNVTSIGGSAFFNVNHISYYGNASGSPWSATHINGFVDSIFVYSDYQKTHLEAYIGNSDNVTIPDGVSHINNACFYMRDFIQDITIPPNTINIGNSAFSYCESLSTILIPDSVTSIGNYAFNGCRNLLSATIGQNVTSIGQYAFSECIRIKSIVIPNNVLGIAQYLFNGCDSLRKVDIGESVSLIGNCAFSGCPLDTIIMRPYSPPPITLSGIPQSCTIIIPCGRYWAYYNSTSWYDYHSCIREPEPGINLTLQENDSSFGTAEIVLTRGVPITCDSTAIIRAQPSFGHFFYGWSNGSVTTPDTIRLSSDSTIVALFSKNIHQLMLTSNNPIMGLLEGSGTYGYGDTVFFVVKANPHFHINNIQSTHFSNPDGSQYYYHWDGTNINDTMMIIMPNEDITISVEFGIDQHTVTLNVNDVLAGATSGSGTYDYGSSAILIAAPCEGYHFSRWSNGSTNNPYSITITQDTILTAFFMPDSTQGINTITAEDAVILTNKGKILVANCNGKTITIHDVTGRLLYKENGTDTILVFNVQLSGVYVVNIDKLLYKKIVVIK